MEEKAYASTLTCFNWFYIFQEFWFDLIRLAECADIAQATRVRAPQNLRPLAGDRMDWIR